MGRFIPFGFKLMLSYCLFIVIPVVVIAYMANSIYVESIREQTRTNIHGTMEQIRDNIAYKLDDAIRVTDLLYFDSKLISILNHYEEGWVSYDATVNYLLPKLRSTISSANSNIWLNVYLRNYTLPEVYSMRNHVVTSSFWDLYQINRIVDQDWYREFPPEQYGETYEWKQVEDDADYHLISLLRRLVDVKEPVAIKEVGFIRVILDIEDVFRSVDYRKIGDGSSLYIVGEDQQIVYYSGESPGQIGTFTAESILSLSKDHLVIREVLPHLDWELVTLVPTDIIGKDIKKVRAVTVMVCLVCIVVFFFIGLMLSRFFSKRVAKIVSVLSAFREGDFHKRMNYRGNDEFSMIATALNDMGANTEALIQEVYLTNIQKKEAELESLQAQINPHFLYNTLSSISRLAKLGQVDKLHGMVTDLAKFYRLTLNEGRTVIRIQHELAQALAYVSIQETKYGDRLNVYWEISPDVFQYQTIKLILQPIIENVFVHAWIGDYIHLRIVACCSDNNEVIFKVIDDGVGIHREVIRQIQDPLDNLNVGIGLRNVDQRIKLHYGKEYGVSIHSRPGMGTTVMIRIPAVLTQKE